jgi:hypothetical protein
MNNPFSAHDIIINSLFILNNCTWICTWNMACNGICVKSTNGITTRYGQGRYDQGQRWCSICELFISTILETSNVCPCCRSKLRSRPRRMKFKNKFRDRISNAQKLSKAEDNHLYRNTCFIVWGKEFGLRY